MRTRRKNLQIGIGLVNSVTVSEFKAVLAHEFGHFSQRSMKVAAIASSLSRRLMALNMGKRINTR
jgi:Zn-dependent protease with chaperone function